MSKFVSITFLVTLHILTINCMILKFSNIICEEFDKPFADFKECKLKILGRNKVGLRIHVRLLQVPVNNITVNAQLFRKSFDYRPFLYNTTVDMCNFFKYPNQAPFWKIVYGLLKPYTNINHTCPYDHDVYVRDMILDGEMYKNLPLPAGEYKVTFSVAAYNHYKARVSVFILGDF